MIKSRFKEWIIVLFIFFGLISVRDLLVRLFTPAPPLSQIKVSEMGFADSLGFSRLNGTVVQNGQIEYLLNQVDENSIFITDINSSNKTYEGYDKIEKAFKIPIVLYFRYNMYAYTDAFNKNIGSLTSDGAMFKDLKPILLAMSTNSSWKDIGVNKNVVKGPIKLYIPKKDDIWYDMIIEEFYFALNDYTVPTAEKREELKPVVESILANCVEVEDMKQSIVDACGNNDYDKVFIGPENIISPLKSEDRMLFSRNNRTFAPCYIKNTLGLYLDLYVKSDSVGEENVSEVKNYLLEDSECFKMTSIRGMNTKIGSYDNQLMDEINITPYMK